MDESALEAEDINNVGGTLLTKYQFLTTNNLTNKYPFSDPKNM